jgi:two-component system chemotaxis sensor kinase CheA
MMPVSVLETDTNIDTVTHRQQGVSGSAIVEDKTILVVNIYEIIDILHPEWSVGNQKHNSGQNGTILLAEDSDFFRGQIERYIADAGYEVISTKDGLEAWQFLDTHTVNIRLVVTDIEMPNMTGLDLCRKIRGDNRYSNLPVIALTSLASQEDEARGKDAGVTDYQVKLDRDRLLQGIKTIAERNYEIK